MQVLSGFQRVMLALFPAFDTLGEGESHPQTSLNGGTWGFARRPLRVTSLPWNEMIRKRVTLFPSTELLFLIFSQGRLTYTQLLAFSSSDAVRFGVAGGSSQWRPIHVILAVSCCPLGCGASFSSSAVGKSAAWPAGPGGQIPSQESRKKHSNI